MERDTIAYLANLEIVAKVVDDAKFGRSFHLSLPGDLAGFSWDEILKQHGTPTPTHSSR